MGRIYRRDNRASWYGDYTTPDGKRIQRSLRTKDKQVAKERLRQAELAATPQARGRRQRLSEAIDHLLNMGLHDRAEATREMYEQKGRRLIATMGDPFIHEIDRDMVSGYIARRLNKEDREHGRAKPHTVQKELITLRRALKEANARDVLVTMPRLPTFSTRYEPKEVWLTPAEFETMVANIGREGAKDMKARGRRARRLARKRPKYQHVPLENRRLWAALAALAGGSASEVERLDWSDVDLAKGWLLWRGKKRETRQRAVPIAPALRSRLEEVPPSERVGKVVRPWSNVRHSLHRACKKAGLSKRVSPNDLRRTFASWLVQQGVAPLVVANLMGHSSTRMVEKVYGRLAPENLEAAIAMLPKRLAAPMTDP